MNKDTHDLSWKDHAPMLLLALCWLAFIGHLYWKAPAPASPASATTTQAYYEQERAGLHGMEHSDLETTEQKLDRIRRRDLAARASLKTEN